jgi:hypothetical protein
VATHDYVISNGTGSAVRSDINGALAAIVSQNSNASAPATTYAYMSWADTSAGVMKMRNGANSAWISLYELDGTFLASDISLAAGSAAAPSLFFTGDTNTGLFSPGADTVALATAGSNRLHITSGGLVGIGTTGPQGKLESAAGDSTDYAIIANNSYTSGDQNYISLRAGSTQIGSINRVTNDIAIKSFYDGVTFFTGTGGTATQKAKIDSSGRLLVGTSTALNVEPFASAQVHNEARYGYASIYRANDASGPALYFIKSRAASAATVVQSGDILGEIRFQGADGGDYETPGGTIKCEVDGTPGANDMPGRLVFSTTADGAASPTERMRITNGGDVYVGKTQGTQNFEGIQLSKSGTGIFAVASDVSLYVNRFTTDGSLVVFSQDSTQEGSISVSGTTVSYNGAHLSRWSQLPGGATREEILRGTVLSNIDEMCGWGEEENEQLNRMKVSDVEGDKNVSGVFQAWDDDDDTYVDDFYCAMTGDFIIRIAEGVTVERGDLLMSAGDGTAKPQDDDIIRSKTVAKVTSTHVTCTYEDGSYCVPCVLMAC